MKHNHHANRTRHSWRICCALTAGFLVISSALAAPSTTDESANQDFRAKCQEMQKLCGGTLGGFARHLESGKTLKFQEETAFPAASVIKLVDAIGFLKRVDAGQYKLSDKLHLTEKDLYPVAHSPMIENFPAAGLDVTFDDLLQQSICKSDTTADAILLAKAGGPAAVQAVMNQAGCPSIHIKETECQLILDYGGVTKKVSDWWNKDKIKKLLNGVSKSEKSLAAKRFNLDPKNTVTPQAIADLLQKLYDGKILKADTTSRLLAIMQKTETGPNRLKGLLPADTIVAHKTGTWNTTDGINSATNDCGIITLPGKAGHIAIAVFTKNTTKTEQQRELAIAKFSKLAFERWIR